MRPSQCLYDAGCKTAGGAAKMVVGLREGMLSKMRNVSERTVWPETITGGGEREAASAI